MSERVDRGEPTAAEAAVLVVPSDGLAALVVRGADRQSWLNGLVTCDLAPRGPGDAAYGLAVERKGRILADLVLVLGADRITLLAPEATVMELRAAFEHYLVMEDAEIGDPEPGTTVFFAHGPRALDVLAAARTAGAEGGALDRTGLGGAVIVARDAAACAAVAAAARDAGGVVGTRQDWEALRLARAVPAFGVDFGPTSYPQEVGLERTAVSFQKGCYLGQEVICMLEMRGHVKRKLALLTVDGAPPAAGAAVADAEGVEVGAVTSAGVDPGAPRRALALAMVKRASAVAGTALRVAGVAAEVVRPV